MSVTVFEPATAYTGDPRKLSISRLFFTNSTGDRLYMLPYKMEQDYAEPILLDPPTPPPPDETW